MVLMALQDEPPVNDTLQGVNLDGVDVKENGAPTLGLVPAGNPSGLLVDLMTGTKKEFSLKLPQF